MEMEDLAVCCLQRKSTLFRNAWRLSVRCSLFAMRLFDERLKTKSSGNYVDYTTEHFLCMKGTNDSLYSSESRK